MDEFIDFSAGYPDALDDADEVESHQPSSFNHNPSLYVPDQSKAGYLTANFGQGMSCDIKPRLTKEQHDILEAHYRKQAKPNTSTKKAFAEQLGVSLDKVNNWFQNRRAKSKQDAKKAAGALSLYAPPPSNLSDSETSPSFMPGTYYTMMRDFSAEDEASKGLGISRMHDFNTLPEQYNSNAPSNEQFQNYLMPPQAQQDMFDSPLEMNRRTLTQEQFDAIARNGGMTNGSDAFEDFCTGFDGEPDVKIDLGDLKQQDVWAFPHPAGAPLSSVDSTVPSVGSEQSLSAFPSSSNMQDRAAMSTGSSDWADSRSSSIYEGAVGHGQVLGQPHAQSLVNASQWQPGQSVPVDFNAQMEEFRQAAQAAHIREQQMAHEQPLAWPSDDAFGRRGSQASLLAHSMSNVELHTPAMSQPATFKSPAPPSSIAARRQRPKPAQLGLASLRSQSYSGAAGMPGSPSQMQHHHISADHAQQLRRIRSSNVIGNVAHGRIMKTGSGSAQRSPMHRNFADAINSPLGMRHMSAHTQDSLAPPTPLSPHELAPAEQHRHSLQWPLPQTHASQQQSNSEGDAEYHHPSASMPAQNFSSPPHTPMFYQQQRLQQQQQMLQQRVASQFNLENTPPQSAPASQTCFPVNMWAGAQPHMPQHFVSYPQSQQSVVAVAHPQQYMSAVIPQQQFPVSNLTFVPQEHSNASNLPKGSPSQGMPVHFANGVPIMSADGNIQMAFPPAPMQFMQHQSAPSPPQLQQTYTPPQAAYQFPVSANGSPHLQNAMQPPKPSSDFFVHEYTPPDSIKSTAMPRRSVDTGPKSYTFANAGPEHFEEKRVKKESISSSSPASSIGTSSTS